jgi:hypothetical protein
VFISKYFYWRLAAAREKQEGANQGMPISNYEIEIRLLFVSSPGI